jgi:hypothetical protein
MRLSLSIIVSFALPFGIKGDRYLVTCGNGKKACSSFILSALKDAGATVIESYPFGVAVIEADRDLDAVISGATVTLDLEMQVEAIESVAANMTDLFTAFQGSTNNDGGGGPHRRLETNPPPFSGDDGT